MYLRKDVVHGLTGLLVPSPKQPHQSQDLDLKEGIRDPRYVVFRAVASCDQGLEIPYEERHGLGAES